MSNNATAYFRSPALVRKAGMSALKKELGTVGAAYFIRQFSTGQGDYTAERDSLLQGITLDEAIRGAREIETQK
ncbi:MAG: hypothetical protein LBH25_00620 [Fibromonadaceae bacterium]|jgi:hypothetical protein|nr:hypothetical protein [Fibromonadaceae bacterium]